MGRKKQEKNEIALKKTAERINALKESRGLTNDELAELMGVCNATARYYRSGTHAMNRQTAQTLYEKTGYIPEYWLGLADEKTLYERWAAIEAAESAGGEEYTREQAEEQAALRDFFKRCGFEYEDLSSSPEYVFGPRRSEGPHCLTRTGSPALSALFTYEELSDLFSKLGDVIELEVYRKKKGLNHSE